MRLIVSSIVRKSSADEPSGWLYSVEVDGKAVRNCYPAPETEYLKYDPNPRGGLRGIRGLAFDDASFYLANATHIRVYSSEWRLKRVITHPSCSDIHDIRVGDGTLLVTSTCNGYLMYFDKEGNYLSHFDYRYYPEITAALQQRTSPAEQISSERVASGSLDFRDPRNFDIDVFDKIHLNSCCKTNGGDTLVLAGQCMPASLAAMWRIRHFLKKIHLYPLIMNLNRLVVRMFKLKRQKNSELALSLPRGLSGVMRLRNGKPFSMPLIMRNATVPNHSLMAIDDTSAVMADTNSGELLRFDFRSGEIIQRIFVADGFLRGVERLPNGLYAVGCQNVIYYVDLERGEVVSSLQLTEDTRVAVYDIKWIPEHFGELPDTLES